MHVQMLTNKLDANYFTNFDFDKNLFCTVSKLIFSSISTAINLAVFLVVFFVILNSTLFKKKIEYDRL